MTDPTPLWRLLRATGDRLPAPAADAGQRYAEMLQTIANEHLLRFRDQWNPTHAAVERWLLQEMLIAQGKGGTEEHDLLRAMDHPEWQP